MMSQIIQWDNDNEKYIKLFDESTWEFNTIPPSFISFDYWASHQAYANELIFDKGVAVKEKGSIHNNPLISSIYGLCCYNNRHNQSKETLEAIVTQSQYCLQLQQNDGRWNYNFDEDKYGLKKPWSSGITQAINSSFLLRMFGFTDDKNYLDASILGLQWSFNSKLNISLKQDCYWIEEYPTEQPLMVLNGYLFWLISAIELQIRKSWIDNELIIKGIKSFFYQYHYFYKNGHLKYAKHDKTISNILYQTIHLSQLKHLNYLIKNDVFLILYHEFLSELNKEFIVDYFGPSLNMDIFSEKYKLADSK